MLHDEMIGGHGPILHHMLGCRFKINWHMFECCLIYVIYVCNEMNGKGRVRRRPGTAAEPEVTPSTWVAIVRVGPGGYMCYPYGENQYPRALVRLLGRHGRVCLV